MCVRRSNQLSQLPLPFFPTPILSHWDKAHFCPIRNTLNLVIECGGRRLIEVGFASEWVSVSPARRPIFSCKDSMICGREARRGFLNG